MLEQTEIPGAERPQIPAIERLAATYREHRDERMACAKAEGEAKGKLLAAMLDHGQKAYRCVDGQVVELHESELTVTVRGEAGKGRPKKRKNGEAEGDSGD